MESGAGSSFLNSTRDSPYTSSLGHTQIRSSLVPGPTGLSFVSYDSTATPIELSVTNGGRNSFDEAILNLGPFLRAHGATVEPQVWPRGLTTDQSELPSNQSTAGQDIDITPGGHLRGSEAGVERRGKRRNNERSDVTGSAPSHNRPNSPTPKRSRRISSEDSSLVDTNPMEQTVNLSNTKVSISPFPYHRSSN